MARRSRQKSSQATRLSAAPSSPLELPDLDDLRQRLRFHPEDGSIHAGTVRMALFHVPAFASLRRELIDSLGIETARGLFTRMGYKAGTIDAEIVRTVRPGRSLLESFAVGPQLQSLEGVLRVDLLHFEYDPEQGRFLGDAIWRNSFEVECHPEPLSSEPVCWMQSGYASGYSTAFVGKPCIVREVECRGSGSSHCRVIGKTVEEWGDDVDDLRYLKPGLFAGRDTASVAVPRSYAARSSSAPSAPDEELVGASPSFHAACHRVRKAASTRATVLFLGETGVGKEMFAKLLHRASTRAKAPLISVNCAAIPESLLEAELFGVEKGAFTGAIASRPGRFERAHGGTLFLDEVGTMPLAAQAKLLRALQAGEIERVGDVRTRKVDVRVVAATNEDLAANMKAGTFRSDLFYRLNVFPIHLPPLRERRDDIPLLMDHILAKYERVHGRRISGFTERAVAALLDYDYPGNIRELENMIESAVILSEDDVPLDVSLLFASTPRASRPVLRIDPSGRLELSASSTIESTAKAIVDGGMPVEPLLTAIVDEALRAADGNYTRAAKQVGLTRAQLAYRAKHGQRSPGAKKPRSGPKR